MKPMTTPPKECTRCGKKNIKIAYYRKDTKEPVFRCADCGATQLEILNDLL